MRARTILLAVMLVVIVGVVIAVGWRKKGPSSFEAVFNPGGKVNFDLSAGGFDIRGSADNKIRVECDPDDLPYVHSEVNINGSSAKVLVDGPPNDFHVTIYVPQRSDLNVFQTVGEVRIEGVDGNKSVGLNIGKISILVPDRTAVKKVEASVDIGGIEAENWHTNDGGFFRSFHGAGQGQYSVDAHVNIGDVRLSEN